MRVLAAMSGGVDSAVAAALAVEAGHEVVGVHMALSKDRKQMREGSRGCCSIEDASDARRAADIIGIPYYVWDMSDKFHDTVVEDFLSEYEAGRTPNPCVRCNEHIKFSALLDKAMALGFDAVVTGHYAIIDSDDDGGLALRSSANDAKDQSYVLAVMGRERLSRAIFPLGTYASKDEVRAEAQARGLGVSNKPDSYDICFVADGDTKGFLNRHLGSRPGEIVDTDGNVVGEHDGSYAYTVGQRRGLSLGRPAADGQPRYVLEIQPVNNRVVVGSVDKLDIDEMIADDAMWLADHRDDGQWHTGLVQVRAHGARVPARYRAIDGGTRLEAHLDETATLRGVAAGQSLVIYEGDRVMAQGTVASSRRSPELVGAGAGGSEGVTGA